MIYACDECAGRHGCTLGTPAHGGPFGCRFCGKGNATSLWSYEQGARESLGRQFEYAVGFAILWFGLGFMSAVVAFLFGGYRVP